MIAPDAVQQVAVAGGGLIGAGMAALFAAGGLDVAIYDPDPGAGARIADAVAQGLAQRARLHGAPARTGTVAVHEDLGAALARAEFVQEAAPEREDLKIGLLAQVDALLPADRYIATSTSALLPSRLQSGAGRPQRIFAAHPINPPYLVPLVELVPGDATDPAALEWGHAFFTRLGCRPIRVRREVEGHVANRLSAAIWREAVSLVLEGVASVQEVDDAMRFGPGLRLACLGPFSIYELAGGPGGFRHYLDHLGYTQERRWRALSTRTTLSDEERERLLAEVQAAMARPEARRELAQRDDALIGILQALRSARGA